MLNEPPSGDSSGNLSGNPPPRRPHPLERRPQPHAASEQPSERVTLHMPTVQPTVTYTLIAINVLVFLVAALSPAWDEAIFLWGADIPARVLLNGEYHRLLTAMFIHASIHGPLGTWVLSNSLHIIFNMYALYAIGRQVEELFGHTRFLIIYLLGGLAGSVLGTLLIGLSSASVGASGAVFAILGAQGVFLYQHRKLFGPAGTAQLRSLVFFALLNLGYGAINAALSEGQRINNWGHLGGLIGGIVLTWFIGPSLIPRRHPDKPNDLIVEDINPLRRRYSVISLYVSALLGILIVASLLARR